MHRKGEERQLTGSIHFEELLSTDGEGAVRDVGKIGAVQLEAAVVQTGQAVCGGGGGE